MKYPGLPPAGRADIDPTALRHQDLGRPALEAWEMIGGTLPGATASIQAILAGLEGDTPTSVAVRLALAEGRRRIAGDAQATLLATDAVAAAERLGDPTLAAAAHLVASVRAWTVADKEVARAELAEARRRTEPGTLASAHCDLAESRLARLHNDTSRAEELTTAAMPVFQANDDPDGLADAQRELAAIALVGREPTRAMGLAVAASDQHHRRGDRYLSVLAGVLVARATKLDHPMEAIESLHAQQAEAVALGSPDLEVLVVTHLSQMLQTTCSQDPERWAETQTAIDRAIELADDPFTMAEVLCARAAFNVRRFEFVGIDRDLDEAARLFEAVGNPAGRAGVAKIRARAQWAQAAHEPGQRLRLRREAARSWSESQALYLAANMPAAARSVVLDQLIGRVVLAGGTLDPEELTLVRSPGDDGDEHRSAVRALLLEAYDHLQSGRVRGARRSLRKARRLLADFPDHQLSAAAAMGLAQVDLASGRPGAALEELHAGLGELSRFDVAMQDATQRSRFVAAVEPLTRQALALAVGSRDPETGLRLLEYRRTGRLSGLLRRREQIRVTPEVSALLDRLDEFRSSDGAGGVDVRSIEAHTSTSWEQCHADLGDATSRLFAEAYDPTGIDVRALVAALPTTCCALILDRPDPRRPRELVRAIVPGGDLSQATIEQVELPPDALRLLDVLVGPGQLMQDIRGTLRSTDLAPLTDPLLGSLATDLASGGPATDLLIVPTGELWAVPFAGLPLATDRGAEALIERATVTVTPSLRFHNAAADRPHRSATGALSWRSPELGHGLGIDEHDGLDVLGALHRRASGPADVQASLRSPAQLDILAIAGHGINEPGLAHGVRLDRGEAVRAADLIGATTARLVLLGACGAGFSPGSESTEPIGFSTLAMCAGAEAVVGPSVELANTEATASYLAALYRALALGGHPSRVHRGVTTTWLGSDENRRRPITEWATMTVLGTVPSG